MKRLPCFSLLILALSCQGSPSTSPSTAGGDIRYAIAIHGGAGVIPKSVYEEKNQAYIALLSEALRRGKEILEQGGTSLDAVEQVVRYLEDEPRFNAGRGAVFTHEGTNELDASIMDGRDLSCGAVTGVETIKNPITLARRVLERSPHVFFAGEGAERFAAEIGLERVDPDYFFTQERYDQLQRALENERESSGEPAAHVGTVGAVALDQHGNLAAATSTGGLTNKRFGRIGDSPVVGAGTYADNKTCAISCTGKGEEFIRHNVAHDISALMEYKELTLQEAAEIVVHQKLRAGDGGIIGVAKDGSIALVFNTAGMFRGAADSTGRFEVKIWE